MGACRSMLLMGIVFGGREIPLAAASISVSGIAVVAAVVVSAVVGVAAAVVVIVVRGPPTWWLWRAVIGGGHTWRAVPYTRWGHNLKRKSVLVIND